MKYIASCSFGKDSLAAIITRIEHGEPIDGAVYCRIMFDEDTSAELPEHEEWIHTQAIPLLKSRYGIETTIVQAAKTYTDYFYTKHEKGGRIGKIYGFPYMFGPWCNNKLKMKPIIDYQKEIGEYTVIVGIAADETKRISRKTVSGKVLPLVDHGIVEKEAFEICRNVDLLSPAYNGGRCRLGCWFCHNLKVGELRRLYFEHPSLWKKLMRLDHDSPVTFKPGYTVQYYNERFSNEELQMKIFK